MSEGRCLIDVGQDASVEVTDEGKPSRSPIDPVRGGCPTLLCSASTVYMRPMCFSTLIRRQMYCVACLAWGRCKRYNTLHGSFHRVSTENVPYRDDTDVNLLAAWNSVSGHSPAPSVPGTAGREFKSLGSMIHFCS